MPIARVNGVSLYYEVAGRGAPLVLVHGFACGIRSWDPPGSRAVAVPPRDRLRRARPRAVGRAARGRGVLPGDVGRRSARAPRAPEDRACGRRRTLHGRGTLR